MFSGTEHATTTKNGWKSYIFAPAKNEGRHQNFEPNKAPQKFENWPGFFGKIQLIFGGGSRGVCFPRGKRPATKRFHEERHQNFERSEARKNSKNGARLAGKIWKNRDQFLEDILVVLFFGGVFGSSYKDV